ncbi:ankyrin repeat protein, putative [Trichomonas vaginalis G3]|uniref:Ankyrin repeat protein, putative n=1 Tax=Trichomonas vaginalis (strain ATCC PRA-98 / G3) TaxID=412133 RepID=A2EB18_TRIV3|nr:spectrin binding [Trichomonas vaginalis G3]EAY10158.1 ankyrin repeat protein, putative [Trichomonas vaginalis G3]KAI5534467.1 spectrin binding [Trichomonas vaginalis G3]|eukprot:XP_001322381.1 ankyrin repeat protein [Trichomonas vaginalis G3]
MTNEENTPFHIAAEKDDIYFLNLFISHGAKINTRCRDQESAMHWAAVNPNPKVAEFLISKGADLYAMTEKDGDSPLHYAVMKNNPELVKFLIEHGAYINVKNKKWETPLHRAILYGSYESMEVLLSKGASWTTPDITGTPPILLAPFSIDFEAIALFLKYLKK